MNKPVQQRTLKTRAKLVDAARTIIAEVGFDGLRTEEVVKRAGVAKGTFFAHFPDKDALLDLLIGEALQSCLSDMATRPAPRSVKEVVQHLLPMAALMTQSRTVFEVIFRHSGAAALDTIGPIAESFGQQVEVFASWFDPASDHPFRRDIAPDLIAEGIQAFALQAMATKFCALHSSVSVEDRLVPYLHAWLMPIRSAE